MHPHTIKKFRDKDGRTGCCTESYHRLYQSSPWIVVRRICNRTISEGDLVVCFSQFGEIIDVRCPRSRSTGDLSGGVAFICYQLPQSAVLAVDNMNSGIGPSGIKVYLTAECKDRQVGIEVDHCGDNEVPPVPPGCSSYAAWYNEEMLGA